MENRLFGFLIDSDIQVDIKGNRVFKITTDKSDQGYVFIVVSLKSITMKLLTYLLIHAKDKEVSREELLRQVWEGNDLSSSNQRLWQVAKELRSRLSLIGIPEGFIESPRGQGYKINNSSIIGLYYETEDEEEYEMGYEMEK
ncbi:winged helix-turn-helix domain-containing protein [Serratia fonticola]|uniref:winged helix-turn-helix domain-containing protein n=1 Tax=Serratia fonticola TaxID=47917 RepID=UPI00192CE938|nr:helix-turn-helix domain-containing protein [Serratia fonticola]MBL5825929.1 winged helix-turn-helix domain-containing protein [Serratia fonticola]